MVATRHSFALFLCLIFVPLIAIAFPKRSLHSKRVGKSSGGTLQPKNKISFKGDLLPAETIGTKYSSIVLECQARGRPSPLIYWLKDGLRLQQDSSSSASDDTVSYEDSPNSERSTLEVSATQSKLFLDCLGEDDEATYSCVAESPVMRIEQSTELKLVNSDDILYSDENNCNEKRSSSGEPARIYMWTKSRLEYENNAVQLFCRAEGNPKPTITWYDPSNRPVQSSENYAVASNGDLVILNVTWQKNMGTYKCVAENGLGTDTSETFVYPAQRGRKSL